MMDPSVKGLNFNHWSTYLSRFTPEPLVGIDSPFSYYGKWMTNFPWHTEENELFSINICYEGVKGWYSVDRNRTMDVIRYVNAEYAAVSNGCANFIRHKRVLLSPTELKAAGIHVHKVKARIFSHNLNFNFILHLILLLVSSSSSRLVSPRYPSLVSLPLFRLVILLSYHLCIPLWSFAASQ